MICNTVCAPFRGERHRGHCQREQQHSSEIGNFGEQSHSSFLSPGIRPFCSFLTRKMFTLPKFTIPLSLLHGSHFFRRIKALLQHPCHVAFTKPITSNIQTNVGAEVQAIVAVPVYSGSGTLFSIRNPTTTGTVAACRTFTLTTIKAMHANLHVAQDP